MFRNQNGEKRSMWNCGTNFPSLPTRVVLGHTSLFFLGFFFRLRCTAMCNLVGTQTASQQTLRDSPTWVSTFIIQSRDRTVSKILFRRYLDFCWLLFVIWSIHHSSNFSLEIKYLPNPQATRPASRPVPWAPKRELVLWCPGMVTFNHGLENPRCEEKIWDYKCILCYNMLLYKLFAYCGMQKKYVII